ncbi:enoyl-CoA hydratase/isomerase family protein [Orrella marina]|uniref:Enoyl-CoA hydratase n=1 Tax=Orrella marina TaxID=2163011 RepID=A0A2R4XGF3_9BURK|nr:enoyl-CoA hydratase-related protein [Orrella marina]AWB32799.1 enoyl-CoA hydratase [Orrella marina]
MSIDLQLDQEGIALVTINRPERRNAFDAEHYRLISEAWQTVRDDPAIRVAVITGAGDKAFSAGADLKTYVGRESSMSEHWLTQKDQLLNRGLEVWKPIIAAVNGYCIGGGMTLLLATDIRVASEHATFGLSEVKRGIVAANGGTQRVVAQLPYPIAMELLLTGDAIDAETALRWGLINKIVPHDRLLDEAMQYARRVAANAPLALQATKELAVKAPELGLSAGLRMEQYVNRMLRMTEDAKEGARAFQEKRAPVFKAN